MKALENSLSCRSIRRTATWIASAARNSWVGRFFLSSTGTPRQAFGDSEVFGLRHSGAQKLERTGHPCSVLIISRPYLRLRGTVGGRAGAIRPEGRWFGGGRWVLVVGAGVFALGCGRVASLIAQGVSTDDAGAALAAPGLILVPAALLVVIGALLFVAGPGLVTASRTSMVARGARWVGYSVVEGRAAAPGAANGEVGAPAFAQAPANRGPGGSGSRVAPLWRRIASPLAVGVALAAAAGLLGGLTYGSGPFLLVAFVVAVCLLALLLWRPEVLLLLLALFPWLDWMARRSLGGLGPLWDDALLLLAVLVLLWAVIVRRRSELWTVPITLPTLLAFAAAIGSVVIREVPSDVAFFALRVLFQPLLFYFLGFLLPKNRRVVQWVVALFLLAGLALALHGLYQYATNAPMPARWVDLREVGSISTRAYSVIGNPNGLGAFLLLGTLLSLSLALTRGLGRLQRSVMALVCAVYLAGVAVTFSRGAWLGLGAGILALLVVAHRRYLAPLVAVGVVGWFVVPQQFVNRLTFAFSSAYIAKSLTAGRLYVWKMALDDIAAHPLFGLGLGTFGGTSATLFSFSRLWVDNFYLQLGAEGGLLLLALFLWVLVRAAKGLLKGHGMTSDPFLRALTAGVFGGWIAVAVANITASVWETLVVGVGFWFLAGLATSAALQSAEVEVAAERAEASKGAAAAKESRGAAVAEEGV